MSQDDLADRLDAVERRLDAAYPEPSAAEGSADGTDRIEAFAERLADLEAAVEAVEGYVGEIERVDDELEQRADAALAATDEVEDRLDAIEERVSAVESDHCGRADPTVESAGRPRPENDGADRGNTGQTPVDAQRESVTGREPAAGIGRVERREPAECTCNGSKPTELRDESGAVYGADSDASTENERTVGDADAPGSILDDVRGERQASRGNDTTGATPRTITDAAADAPTKTADGRARSADEPNGPASGAQHRSADRQRAVGTDGGQTGDRRGGDAAVSGWGDATETAAGQGRADRGRRDGGRGDGRTDDGNWGDSSTETLLDRLRSML